MLPPLAFHPIFKERVWGGRNIESLFGKQLPPEVPIGESWEITDRPEGVSVIARRKWCLGGLVQRMCCVRKLVRRRVGGGRSGWRPEFGMFLARHLSDQWEHTDRIHWHAQGISLGGALL